MDSAIGGKDGGGGAVRQFNYLHHFRQCAVFIEVFQGRVFRFLVGLGYSSYEKSLLVRIVYEFQGFFPAYADRKGRTRKQHHVPQGEDGQRFGQGICAHVE